MAGGPRRAPGFRSHTNARAREQMALDLRSQGYLLDEIAERCGFTHRSTALQALRRAQAEMARETLEEARALFQRNYAAVRVGLSKRARLGDVRATEALVKLDEREAKLFGYDATPTTVATPPIILEVPASIAAALRGQPLIESPHDREQPVH